MLDPIKLEERFGINYLWMSSWGTARANETFGHDKLKSFGAGKI